MDLVTGGAGFLGRMLVERLLEKGERVRVVGRRRAGLVPLKEAGAEVLLGDLRDPLLAFRAVEGADRVFHLAGVRGSVEPLRFWQDNVEASLSLSRAFARWGRGRLVALSSLAAAGPCALGLPRVEQDREAPIDLYGRSKLAGEQAVRSLPEPASWVVLRPSLIYGPGTPEMLELIQGVRHGRVSVPKPDQVLSLVHVEDLIAALLLCASHPEAHRKVFFLAGNPDLSVREIVALLGRALGRTAQVVETARYVSWLRVSRDWARLLFARRPGFFTPDRFREGQQPSWRCSSARIRSELGWQPVVSHGEGFQQIVARGCGPGMLAAGLMNPRGAG